MNFRCGTTNVNEEWLQMLGLFWGAPFAVVHIMINLKLKMWSLLLVIKMWSLFFRKGRCGPLLITYKNTMESTTYFGCDMNNEFMNLFKDEIIYK